MRTPAVRISSRSRSPRPRVFCLRRPVVSIPARIAGHPLRYGCIPIMLFGQGLPISPKGTAMPLTLQEAQTVITGAHERAAQIAAPVTVAVVDEGGHLQALGRMTGAPPLSA